MSELQKKKIIIGISGASGAIYGVRLLEVLRETEIETHLIVSKAAAITIAHETEYKVSDVIALADHHYAVDNIAACISSGSFATMGMIVAPCSVKTMSEIACGTTTNLLSRAADVILKERRRLVLMVRETPFHLGHMRTMTQLSEMGAIVAPPLPAFYPKPQTVEDIVIHSVGRVLDLVGVDTSLVNRWDGIKSVDS
jgi:4-hydroxy-3-polyprenylbenzoate decarboxylase